MKRSEGIIKRYKLDEYRRPVNLNGKKLKDFETRLLETEYNNYTELCYFCYEEPIGFKEWCNQTINPQK